MPNTLKKETTVGAMVMQEKPAERYKPMNILPQNGQQWLTVKEYANKYRVVPLTVYRLVKAEKVTYKKLGGTIRILDETIPLSERETKRRAMA